MDIQFLVAQLFNGLVVGSIYVILSLGLTIILGMLGVVNFAHGGFYMLGAYGVYTLMSVCSYDFWTGLFLSPIIAGFIGMVIEYTLLRRVYDIPAFYSLLLTFGVMIVLQEIIQIIYTPMGKPFNTPEDLTGSFSLGFMLFPKFRLFVLGTTAFLAIAIWLLLEKTKLGIIIRAGTEDSQMLDALGINTPMVYTLVFGIGASLAGFAGALTAPIQNIFPYMGMEVMIDTFIVVIIGGMGSIMGSILGGIIIGELITLGVIFWPPVAHTLIYIFMVIILIFRPRGLFGREKFFE